MRRICITIIGLLVGGHAFGSEILGLAGVMIFLAIFALALFVAMAERGY